MPARAQAALRCSDLRALALRHASPAAPCKQPARSAWPRAPGEFV